jgi:hypothetical protein
MCAHFNTSVGFALESIQSKNGEVVLFCWSSYVCFESMLSLRNGNQLYPGKATFHEFCNSCYFFTQNNVQNPRSQNVKCTSPLIFNFGTL